MFTIDHKKYPGLVGFDRHFDLLNSLLEKPSINNTAYPPYNLIKLPDNKYIIEMAVAGISKDSLEVLLQENILQIAVVPKSENSFTDKQYLYRGIAERAFTRSFTLADTVKVTDVVIDNGLLRIYLENEIPEVKKLRKLEIRDNTATKQLLMEETNVTENSGFT